MKKIAVIGTGLSALSLAHHLPSLDITFFEKSWRPGGRISTRRHEDYAFDHGAHYIKEDHGVIGFNEYLEKYLVDKQRHDYVKVDLFIIQNLSIEDEDLDEKWKELDELELSNHLINIKTEPTTFVTFPEGKLLDEIPLPPLKIKVQPQQQRFYAGYYRKHFLENGNNYERK